MTFTVWPSANDATVMTAPDTGSSTGAAAAELAQHLRAAARPAFAAWPIRVWCVFLEPELHARPGLPSAAARTCTTGQPR